MRQLLKLSRDDLARHRREERVAIARYEKFVGAQIRFLKRNEGKPIYISQDFHGAALRELETTFRLQEERGMIVIIKEHGGTLNGTTFYDANWVESKFYGHEGMRIWFSEKGGETMPGNLGSFAFDFDRVIKLQDNVGGIAIECHTHPILARPSPLDLEHSFCGIVIGFETVTDSLKDLVKALFYKSPIQRKMEDGKEVLTRIRFPLPTESYQRVIEECTPTVKLFYAKLGQEPKEVPLTIST